MSSRVVIPEVIVLGIDRGPPGPATGSSDEMAPDSRRSTSVSRDGARPGAAGAPADHRPGRHGAHRGASPRRRGGRAAVLRQIVLTAFAVGQARGVVLLAAAQAGLAVHEYGPHEVMSAVTGYGKASEDQVQRMVQAILGLTVLPRPDDAADALAVAVCLANAWRPAVVHRHRSRGSSRRSTRSRRSSRSVAWATGSSAARTPWPP